MYIIPRLEETTHPSNNYIPDSHHRNSCDGFSTLTDNNTDFNNTHQWWSSTNHPNRNQRRFKNVLGKKINRSQTRLCNWLKSGVGLNSTTRPATISFWLRCTPSSETNAKRKSSQEPPKTENLPGWKVYLWGEKLTTKTKCTHELFGRGHGHKCLQK